MAEIKVIVDKKNPLAGFKLEAMGYQGGKCIQDIDELTKALDAQTISTQAKPELNMVKQRGTPIKR